ncbi:MAG: sulfite exporter TauE/SafE family protein [Nocardioidaceae bacterium]|nr:sulfite exporter TauE/SafE family protein [Nocardioidaceae bacterium]
MDPVLTLAAGFAAGAVNTAVGSGSLVSFPLLMAGGLSPVHANIANTVGLVPGSLLGAYAYRAEVPRGGHRSFVPLAVAGGLAGACLLTRLPAAVFEAAVPVIVLVASVLVLTQRQVAGALDRALSPRSRRVGGRAGVLATSVYGGYFSAAQGVLFTAVLGLVDDAGAQATNARKNLLQALVNTAAASVFVVSAHVSWAPVALVAAGGLAGAPVGAAAGRRLSARALRTLVALVGLATVVRLVV